MLRTNKNDEEQTKQHRGLLDVSNVSTRLRSKSTGGKSSESDTSTLNRMLIKLGIVKPARAHDSSESIIFEPVITSTPVFSETKTTQGVDDKFVQNFADLNAFGPGGYLTHPDFDNDITIYMLTKQASAAPRLLEILDGFVESGQNTGQYQDYTFRFINLIALYTWSHNAAMTTEVFFRAVHYFQFVFVKHAEKMDKDKMRCLAIASLNVARKFEMQCSRPIKGLYAVIARETLFKYEIMVMESLDYLLSRESALTFMRLHQCSVMEHMRWQWPFAKALCQLALFQPELAVLEPSHLAGVVMRIVALINNSESFTAENFTISCEIEENYHKPTAMLCDLALQAEHNPDCYKVYEVHARIFAWVFKTDRQRFNIIEKFASQCKSEWRMSMLGQLHPLAKELIMMEMQQTGENGE